jgi:hypothetical protein
MVQFRVSWHDFTARGAVAQLGERQLCKLDVVGSNPISSTDFSRETPSVLRKRSLTSAYEGRIKDFC